MPATSKAQQRLMAAAEHGADFPMAKKLRKSMTKSQLHDFASGSQEGKPEHVKAKHRTVSDYKQKGLSERDATLASLKGKK